MLEIRKLTAGYQDVPVLRELSLTLHPNSISVLMGPNGAGKSTLLKSIFNLVNVTGGAITYNGEELTGLPADRLLAKGIAYVPQGKVNFSALTVGENLRVPSTALGAGFRSAFRVAPGITENIERVLTVFPELREKLKARAYTLSGGQQQMLAMARALVAEPKLLLLDEPSLGLSPKLVQETFRHIQRINQELGTTILLVEHNIKSVIDIADYGFILVDGQLAAADTTAALRHSDILQKVFVGTFE